MGETVMKEIQIWSEYITLGQLLKLANVISNGAEAKSYLAEVMPLVNGEDENRRGKKLYPGDMIQLPDGQGFSIVAQA
jgi:S4 domain protein YaaA